MQADDRRELISDMAAAIRDGGTLPKMPPELGFDEAYRVQQAVVAAVAGDRIAGRKAGMTSAAMRQQFGVDRPLLATLYEAGRLAPGAAFPSLPGVMLECEIGLVVDAGGAPQSVGPVIEVPRMAFADSDDLTAPNMIACSIAADRFIAGRQLPLLDRYDQVQVVLGRNGETLSSAPATEALDGPLAALEWMLEESRLRGFPVADGMLFITGACGGLHPAKPGRYAADYGPLGSIEFTVT